MIPENSAISKPRPFLQRAANKANLYLDMPIEDLNKLGEKLKEHKASGHDSVIFEIIKSEDVSDISYRNLDEVIKHVTEAQVILRNGQNL